MLWHAYALLAHGADRVGLRPARAKGAAPPLRSEADVLRVLERIDEAAWLANALAAAAESGLVHHWREPARPEDLAMAAKMPPALARGLLDLFASLGLATCAGGRFAPAPGLKAFLDRNGASAFRHALRAPLLQAESLRRRADEGALDLEGWRFEDPAVIEAQGALTALWAERAIPKLKFLPGLVRALSQPGAALLDVGAGAAGLSIALCRHFPDLRVVALEPAPHPAAIGERAVETAGLRGRVTLRRQRVEHMTDEAAFDLAFLPQMFLADSVIAPATAAIHRALKPGGWLLAAVLARRGGEPSAALSRLKNLLWGGNAREDAALKPLLLEAGFAPVIRAPGGGVIRMVCARRSPRPLA